MNAVRAAGGTPRSRARAPTVSGVPCDWDYLRGVWVRPDGDDYDARVAKAERAEELRWRAMQSDGRRVHVALARLPRRRLEEHGLGKPSRLIERGARIAGSH